MLISSRSVKFGLAAVAASVLVACGSSDDLPLVAASNITVQASATTAAATSATLQTAATVSFPAAVSVLQTPGATTLAVGATTTATITKTDGTTASVTGPKVTISSGTYRAEAIITYGSCVFNFTDKGSYTGPNPLVVESCSVVLGTSGVPADGSEQSVNMSWVLGGTTGTSTVKVKISESGTATVNNVTAGVTEVKVTTGTGG